MELPRFTVDRVHRQDRLHVLFQRALALDAHNPDKPGTCVVHQIPQGETFGTLRRGRLIVPEFALRAPHRPAEV
jgi:hypothetical protein